MGWRRSTGGSSMIISSYHDFRSLRRPICPVCPTQTRDITSSGWERTDGGGGLAASGWARHGLWSRGQAAAGVDLGGLGHQRGAAGQAAGGQRARQRGQLRLGGASGPERFVDREHLLVAQLGQLGGAAQVLGELRVRVLLRDRSLPFQRVRVNPQVREADLATPDGIEGELIDRPPGQGPDLGRPATDSSSAGAPGLTQARSRAISAITVVWYLASIASSV